MDYITFGRELRKLRQQRGLTQEKLAELVDLSVPYISHLERGTKKPSLVVLTRLAESLGVTVEGSQLEKRLFRSGSEPASQHPRKLV